MKSKEIKSRVFRSKCEELLKTGESISAIAKITNATYKHTKNICEQIKTETNKEKNENKSRT